MSFDVTEVAARMRRLRREQGLSLYTVGERLGVSHAALSYAERGSRRLDLQFLNGYAAAIGVDVATLLGGSAPPDEAPADVLAQLRAAIERLTTAIERLTTHLNDRYHRRTRLASGTSKTEHPPLCSGS